MNRRTTPRPKALWVQIRDAAAADNRKVQELTANVNGAKRKFIVIGSEKKHIERLRKARKRVRQVSAAQREKLKEYEGAKRLFLMGRTRCERCGCVRRLELHHKRGRSGTLLADHRYFAALCGGCHRWVHEHPAKAREHGLLAGPGEWGKADA